MPNIAVHSTARCR